MSRTCQLRPIIVDGDTAYVTLTRGYVATVDASDVHLIDGYNWAVMPGKSAIYAVRSIWTDKGSRSVFMHRTIMGEPDGKFVDHIDGDGLNNRRSNLREATGAQNSRNSRLRRNNVSGFKGVSWIKRPGKWSAQIMVDGKQSHLGFFSDPKEAHAAYVRASEALHGEFGRTE